MSTRRLGRLFVLVMLIILSGLFELLIKFEEGVTPLGTTEWAGWAEVAMFEVGGVSCSSSVIGHFDSESGESAVANGARSIAACYDLGGEVDPPASFEISDCINSGGVWVGYSANSEWVAIPLMWSLGYSA